MKNISHLQEKLLIWFKAHQRNLPWRKTRDPYAIWISEIMLQQTTSAAVISYFEKFLKAFPTVHDLARSPLEKVYENWAGLGYYSRARNLHKAAELIAQNGFPKTHTELIQLPGFGPYTSCSVASLAFNEQVGVVDGNVIRVLSRLQNKPYQWWQTHDRKLLQDFANELAQTPQVSGINQGLMELGATICTPQNPACTLCPWMKSCQALKAKTVTELPLKKQKKENEFWLWQTELFLNKDKIFLKKNEYAPFLKNSLLPLGKAQKVNKKPKNYLFQHTITHHKIYVTASLQKIKSAQAIPQLSEGQWVHLSEVPQYNPASLLQKLLKHGLIRD